MLTDTQKFQLKLCRKCEHAKQAKIGSLKHDFCTITPEPDFDIHNVDCPAYKEEVFTIKGTIKFTV